MSEADEAGSGGESSGGEPMRQLDDRGLVARTSLIVWHAQQNDADAVRRMLEEDGALVNARDYDGRTPLHVAALHGWLDVAECLLANGADLNAQDSWRNTPLADAEGAKRHAMIELLKKYGGLTYGQSGSHFEAKTIPPPLTNNDDWELNPLEYDFTKATIGKVYNGEGSSIFSSNITPGSSSEFDHKSTGENVSNKTVGIPGKGDYPSASMEQSSSYIKEPEKVLHPQAPSTTTFNSTESEPFSSSYPPIDSSPEVADIQGMLQQVVQRFQELFSQTKYKEAAELAVEFPQGLLRTPETVAKFKGAPLQLGQVSPLLQYFATLLTRGKLNAYESLELSRLAISQNGKNLLEGWLADDKLECSEELGHLVKTVDDDLALKIYIKARDNPRVVAAFNERIEFDNIIIYPKLPEKAGTLKGPGEISYKVYNGEGSSIFSSNITSGSSSEMADLASEIEALDRILSDASAQPTKLSYALMKSVTNNFSKVIGRGGFAVVYQGFLRNGKIAVKKLSLSNGFSDELFVDEIECLTKAKHNNVVRYLGYCADTQGELMEFNGRCVIAEVPKRLLCFEFVPNGSLQRYLKAKLCGDEWQVRYKMIKGICQGLHFLHKIRINHLDLKPGNILLDVGMEPKIADFGLSRCFDEEQSRVFTKNICGTRGYIAPEIINRGEISFKSDIFALGIIIIKLLTGHNDYDIENWHKSLNAGCQQVRRCIEIAQACVDDDQHKRPAIGEIIHKLDELEASVNSPAIN